MVPLICLTLDVSLSYYLVLDYQFRLKQIAIQRIRMQQIHDLVDKKISLSDLIKRDVFCPFEFTLALNKFGTTQLITRWDPIRSHQCLVELTNNTFTIPFVDFQIQLEYKVKFTDGNFRKKTTDKIT